MTTTTLLRMWCFRASTRGLHKLSCWLLTFHDVVVSMCSLTDPDVEFIGPGTHYAILLCTTISDETYGIVHSS